jgi:hypothetical protein
MISSFPSGAMANVFQISKTKNVISNCKYETFSFQIFLDGINEIFQKYFSFPSDGMATCFPNFKNENFHFKFEKRFFSFPFGGKANLFSNIKNKKHFKFQK